MRRKNIRREHPWQAPEYAMLSTRPRTTTKLQKSDIFSFGVVLSEIISMSLPQGLNKDDRVLCGKGLSYKTFSPVSTRVFDVSTRLRKIVRKCSRIDPDSRPSSEYLVEVLNRLSKELEDKTPKKLSNVHNLIRHVSSNKNLLAQHDNESSSSK